MTSQSYLMQPYQIDAVVAQLRVDGASYIPQLGGPPLSIHEWKERELKRWHEYSERLTIAKQA